MPSRIIGGCRRFRLSEVQGWGREVSPAAVRADASGRLVEDPANPAASASSLGCP